MTEYHKKMTNAHWRNNVWQFPYRPWTFGCCNGLAVVPIADGAVRVIYQTPDGTLKERLLGRADEEAIAVATTERPWSFVGDGEAFKLTVEAKRIDLAFLFDPMMAVHTSNVEPLPHQITAVYEAMLPRQPLRFVLADDPGAGKTIMAGSQKKRTLPRKSQQVITSW